MSDSMKLTYSLLQTGLGLVKELCATITKTDIPEND